MNQPVHIGTDRLCGDINTMLTWQSAAVLATIFTHNAAVDTSLHITAQRESCYKITPIALPIEVQVGWLPPDCSVTISFGQLSTNNHPLKHTQSKCIIYSTHAGTTQLNVLLQTSLHRNLTSIFRKNWRSYGTQRTCPLGKQFRHITYLWQEVKNMWPWRFRSWLVTACP
jgi:hypothetical protein